MSPRPATAFFCATTGPQTPTFAHGATGAAKVQDPAKKVAPRVPWADVGRLRAQQTNSR